MKKGEFYRSKWNKYVVRVTDVKWDYVELMSILSKTTERIKKENFDMNFESCDTIYKWRQTIESAFSFGEIQLIGDAVRVKVDTTIIDFSIDVNDMLVVSFTDDIKEAVESDKNILRFLIEDADEVISMFADLFE